LVSSRVMGKTAVKATPKAIALGEGGPALSMLSYRLVLPHRVASHVPRLVRPSTNQDDESGREHPFIHRWIWG
jgi:hypothetical protein